MKQTPFPTRPVDVVALTLDEFRIDLEREDRHALNTACQLFRDDPNRALVWLIRLAAVKALSARADIAHWRQARPSAWRDVCEVAASFELNQQWEFDVGSFCFAVDALATERATRGQS
jgi:hypothetical protein